MKCQCLLICMENPQQLLAGDSPRLRGSLTGDGTALKQEGSQDEDTPRLPDGDNRADAGNESDEATIPEEHEGPRNQKADDEDEDDESKEDG